MQVFIVNAQLAIVQQWMIPTALNSLQPFNDMHWAKMVERVLLLAVSSPDTSVHCSSPATLGTTD